jgi:hypothetical protein
MTRGVVPCYRFSARRGRLRRRRRDACSGRVPSASTDDRLTLASVSNCESADVVVRHDCWSSLAGASRTSTRALASGRKRVRERKTGCSPVPVDAGMASALLLAKCRVLAAPDAGPLWLRRRHFHRASDPAQGSAGACRRRAVFRSHVATSTAGFDLVRRCRFVRPQRLLGCGSRREAWRGSRRRGWRRCSGSARGLARSRGCFCRWRVA